MTTIPRNFLFQTEIRRVRLSVVQRQDQRIATWSRRCPVVNILVSRGVVAQAGASRGRGCDCARGSCGEGCARRALGGDGLYRRQRRYQRAFIVEQLPLQGIGSASRAQVDCRRITDRRQEPAEVVDRDTRCGANRKRRLAGGAGGLIRLPGAGYEIPKARGDAGSLAGVRLVSASRARRRCAGARAGKRSRRSRQTGSLPRARLVGAGQAI